MSAISQKLRKMIAPSAVEWTKAELEPLAFWSKQLLAVLLGVLMARIQFGALAALSCAGGVVLLVSRWMRRALVIPDDVMSENDLFIEGLAPAFQTFLVAWIMAYTQQQEK